MLYHTVAPPIMLQTKQNISFTDTNIAVYCSAAIHNRVCIHTHMHALIRSFFPVSLNFAFSCYKKCMCQLTCLSNCQALLRRNQQVCGVKTQCVNEHCVTSEACQLSTAAHCDKPAVYIWRSGGGSSIFSQATIMEDAYSVLCQIRSVNKVFRRACSQVILLNHKIEAAKTRYDRARSVRRLSFRYSNRLKLTSLEGVRNLIYEHACAKCEEIEALQAKLRQLTGGVYDFAESDASESEENFSD